MKKIVVIGSSNTDLVIKTSRIPQPGETILGGEFIMAAGGKGGNQAVAVSRLGGDITFIAKVGDDMFGAKALQNYSAEGIDTSLIFQAANSPSGVALISVDQNGENSIVVAPGANSLLDCADIFKAIPKIKEAEYLLMQLEIPMETIAYAINVAFDNGVKVILNPAPAAEISDALMAKLYMITPNRSETQLLTNVEVDDMQGIERAADVLLSRGVENVVITLGSQGAFVKNKTICQLIPAQKVQAVDTTGAGDTFNGALCVALAQGRDIVDAINFASEAAAISVTRMGAQPSIPFLNQMRD